MNIFNGSEKMSNEYGNYKHIESNWSKTQSISTEVTDNFVKVIKNVKHPNSNGFIHQIYG